MEWALTVTFDTIGPLAYSVADIARTFAALSGLDPADPSSADRPVENFLPTIGDGIEGMRIGLPRRFFFEGLQPEVEASVLAAAHVLERAGAKLVDIDIAGIEEAQDRTFSTLVTADVAAVHREQLSDRTETIGEGVRRRMELGLTPTARDYSRSLCFLFAFRRDICALYQGVDLILTLTTPITAPRWRGAMT